tara:strand:- start:154 stop:534 length:381 start_codon:yes stop_codon:yes gene_type:complete
MKIVKNKTLKKDPAKRRGTYNDSPLRYPMNVHMTDTHERRINWLYYENSQICKEYISAQLLYVIAKLRYKSKQLNFINLREYKAIKEALDLWQEVIISGDVFHNSYVQSFDGVFKYHYVGDEEEEE